MTMTDIEPSLEQRGINVIRGLAMDAVQKANSGHPGTPMALAPLAARAVDAHHEVRRAPTRLARPRPLRALERARVDAALLDALPHRLRARARRPARVPAVGLAHAGPPRVPPHRRASRSRPVRSARASPTGSASALAETQPARPLRRRGRRPPRVRYLRRRRPRWRASATKPRRSPATSGSAASCTSTTTTTSRSTARPSSRTATTSRSASRATAGTSSQLGEVAERPRRARGGLREGMAEDRPPDADRAALHIGYPSPKFTDTAKAHGNPLGADEVAAVKEILGLPPEDFYVPDDVLAFYRAAGTPRRAPRATRGSSGAPRSAHARARAAPTSTTRASSSAALAGWEQKLPTWKAGEQVATRDACTDGARRGRRRRARADRAAAPTSPATPAWTSRASASIDAHRRSAAASIHFGIREHGMGAAMNGMAVSGLLPAGRHVLRVQRLHARRRCGSPRSSQYKVAFVWTHDSVGRRRGRPDAPARSSSSRRCARCPGSA